MPRYCLAVDLLSDAQAIAAYDDYHTKVWPEILDSLAACGILKMEIYRYLNRLFLLMETTDDFSLERKAAMDAANPAVQRWEELMANYQRAIPGTAPGQKWGVMEMVFNYTNA